MEQQLIQSEGPLFEAVQRLQLFTDSKTFPDATLTSDPQVVLQQLKTLLDDFVAEHFELPTTPATHVTANLPLAQHIDQLWDALTRPPDPPEAAFSTRIPLAHAYVVPGGRFRESYYWDTFFTAQGLVASGRIDLLESMIKNFADLIDRYGHIPNGNRSYYLSRSQPPFFCSMLQLLEHSHGTEAIQPYLAQLEAEYAFWMDGSQQVNPGQAHRRVVHLADGTILNRYWDDANTPRQEAHAQDLEVYANSTPERQPSIYRNLRAAAESGWDFSSRWLVAEANGSFNLTSIRTTELLPVDLNCLLYQIEQQLATWQAHFQLPNAPAYADAAARRRAAIQQYCWNVQSNFFHDYAWAELQQSQHWTLAGLFPLYVGLASVEQAIHVADAIQTHFLQPGGVATTLHSTGQQWDAPNGWAPLQWVTVAGLRRYGHTVLADEIAGRFVGVAERVYRETGKLMEKYDVCNPERPGGGGEYPNQDGFGWTNGVVRAWLS